LVYVFDIQIQEIVFTLKTDDGLSRFCWVMAAFFHNVQFPYFQYFTSVIIYKSYYFQMGVFLLKRRGCQLA